MLSVLQHLEKVVRKEFTLLLVYIHRYTKTLPLTTLYYVFGGVLKTKKVVLRRPNSSIKMCLKECLVLQSTPSQSLSIAVLPYLKYFVLPLPLCPTVLGYR